MSDGESTCDIYILPSATVTMSRAREIAEKHAGAVAASAWMGDGNRYGRARVIESAINEALEEAARVVEETDVVTGYDGDDFPQDDACSTLRNAAEAIRKMVGK